LRPSPHKRIPSLESNLTEGTTHIARQLTPAVFYNDNDPFIYNPSSNNETTSSNNNASTDLTPLPIQGIALRPLTNYNLHKDNKDIQITPTDDNSTAVIEKESDEVSEISPFALGRFQRTARPSTQLQESLKYLNRPIANNVENEN